MFHPQFFLVAEKSHVSSPWLENLKDTNQKTRSLVGKQNIFGWLNLIFTTIVCSSKPMRRHYVTYVYVWTPIENSHMFFSPWENSRCRLKKKKTPSLLLHSHWKPHHSLRSPPCLDPSHIRSIHEESQIGRRVEPAADGRSYGPTKSMGTGWFSREFTKKNGDWMGFS